MQNIKTLTDFQKLCLPKGRGAEGGRMNWGISICKCTLRYVEWSARGDLLYNIGNSTQYSMIIYVEKEYEWEWLYVQYGRNYHNIINQPYFNKTLKNEKKENGTVEHYK